MAISGTDPAPLFALAGVGRAGAMRAGYVSSDAYVSVGGTARRGSVSHGSMRITDRLDHEPNTGVVTFENDFTPAFGDEVVVQLGSTGNADRLFGGRILSTRKRYQKSHRQSVLWDCSLVDYTWELNQKRVRGRFLSQDASVIIKSLVDTFAPEFTYANVDDTLGTIDEIVFTEEQFDTAITRIMRRIGGYWKIDYHRDLHARLTASGNAPTDLTDAHNSLHNPFVSEDGSQITTRVMVEGHGTQTLEAVAVGDTSIPVADASIFDALGGSLKAEFGQILTYTGTNVTADGSSVSHSLAAPGALTATDGTNVGVLVGSYQYKVALASDTGMTAAGTASNTVTPDKSYTWPSQWFAQSIPTASVNFWSVDWSPSLALYCGIHLSSATAYTSPDGISWTQQTGLPSANWRDVVWAEGLSLWVAVAASGATRVATSPDGVTWTGRTAASLEEWESVGWSEDDTLLVAVTTDQTPVTSQVMTSADGITWTNRTAAHAAGWNDVVFSSADSLWVVSSGSTGTNEIMTSPDGITWTSRTTTTGGFTALAHSPELGLFVAVIGGTDDIETSADGLSWTKRSAVLPESIDWTDIVWAPEPGRFVLVGEGGLGNVATSLNGTTAWLQEAGVSGSAWKCAAWSPSLSRAVVLGTASIAMTQTVSEAGETVALSSIPVGGAPTTSRVLLRTKAGGSDFYFLDQINDNTTTVYTDNIADTELGELAPTVSTIAAVAGNIAVRVQDTANFAAGGGWASAGNQIIKYGGRSVSSGEGTLSGVPASGVGSIKAEIAGGTAILPIGSVEGVPASGAGSVTTALGVGDNVHIYITRNNSAAQTSLASTLGGSADGIFEEFIQDRRLSQTECEARGDAVLALQKVPFAELRYQVRDPKTVSGKTITVNLTAPQSIAADYKIQSVVIDEINTAPNLGADTGTAADRVHLMPRRTVTASTMRFSLPDLLRQMRQGSETRQG